MNRTQNFVSARVPGSCRRTFACPPCPRARTRSPTPSAPRRDVLDHALAGEPIGRIVGMDAMHFDWHRLNVEYSKQFGVEPRVPPKSSKG